MSARRSRIGKVVLTIPKRLRVHTRFDRGLLGKLSSCAWTCLKEEARRLLAREDVVPGMIGAIQTRGQLLYWHPHLHVLIVRGDWTPEGEFLELPEFEMRPRANRPPPGRQSAHYLQQRPRLSSAERRARPPFSTPIP